MLGLERQNGNPGRKEKTPMKRTPIFLGALVTVLLSHVAYAETFTVTSFTDGIDIKPGDGVCRAGEGCTLRAAIMEVNALSGSHAIILPAGTYTLTLLGRDDSAKSGDLDIRRDLIIVSSGGLATIEGSPGWNDRIFDIGAGVTVQMKGLHIRNGNDQAEGADFGGGGILNLGTLILSSCQVTDNKSNFEGGGIVNYGTLQLFSVDVSNNSSLRGGGVSNFAAMAAFNSTIQNNRTRLVSISPYLGGGGIYNGSPESNLTLMNVDVVFNSTPLSPGNGGSGGGILNEAGTVTASMSEISGNKAARGGGLSNLFGTVNLTDTNVANNIADVTVHNSIDPIDLAGGGILNTSGVLTLVRTSVTGNRAPGSLAGGGGIYIFSGDVSLTDSTVSNNQAYAGGGIINTGRLTLNRSTVSLNSATFGGGIDSENGTTASTGFNLAITNSTISGNRSAQDGGGILYAAAGAGTLTNVTVTRNEASTGGGISIINATLSLGNSIIAGNAASVGPDCRTVANPTPTQLTSQGFNLIQNANDCVIAGNTANNLIGADPKLGPLQDNGGATLTHALLAGSPLIDRGAATCVREDQRGASRPADGNNDGFARCDSGAFEVDPKFLGFAILEPDTAAVAVHDRLTYAFTWIVPPALGGWRAALDTLELRIRDGEGTVFWLRFDEPTGTFTVFNDASGKFGQSGVPGTAGELHTPFATLYLDDSAIDGPPGHRVTLTIAVSFKPRAAGRRYLVEVRATGGGHQQGFEKKGQLIVTR